MVVREMAHVDGVGELVDQRYGEHICGAKALGVSWEGVVRVEGAQEAGREVYEGVGSCEV